MIPQWRRQPNETRRHFHRRTPWLFFHHDHPLSHERWKKPKRKYEETFSEQADRLHEILVLPGDDDDWSDSGDDDDDDDDDDEP